MYEEDQYRLSPAPLAKFHAIARQWRVFTRRSLASVIDFANFRGRCLGRKKPMTKVRSPDHRPPVPSAPYRSTSARFPLKPRAGPALYFKACINYIFKTLQIRHFRYNMTIATSTFNRVAFAASALLFTGYAFRQHKKAATPSTHSEPKPCSDRLTNAHRTTLTFAAVTDKHNAMTAEHSFQVR